MITVKAISNACRVRDRDVDGGFADADLVHETEYHCAEVCQVQTEPHAAYVEYDGERDELTVVPRRCVLRASDAVQDPEDA